MSKEPQEKADQLLPNRGVLSQINPVVRKSENKTEVQLPSEWDPSTANAYRLLVGPKITSFVTPESTNESKFENVENDQKAQSIRSLFSKLRPSRLTKPFQPEKVRKSQMRALALPNDLLVRVLPEDYTTNFDLLDYRTRKRTKSKNNRPSFSPHSFSTRSSLPSTLGTPVDIETIDLMDEYQEEETNNEIAEQNEETSPLQSEQIQSTSSIPSNIATPQTTTRKHIFVPSARDQAEYERMQSIRFLRTFFYILRCWAVYHSNTRLKASFILEVSDTRIKLHALQKWHNYVSTINRLQNNTSDLQQRWNSVLFQRYFSQWKEKARNAIINYDKASIRNQQINTKMLRRFLHLFRDTIKSKRISRRDIDKNFRYNSNGPFVVINGYYTKKREQTIKARHFNFTKVIPRCLRGWIFIKERSKLDRQRIESIHFLIGKDFFWSWHENYQRHFQQRYLEDVRFKAKQFNQRAWAQEKETSEKVEKSVMLQLVKDRNILRAKLSQFDRLRQNHSEAILRRQQARKDIQMTTNIFFKRQEELQLIDCARLASDVEKKTRDVRTQLADGFLFHINRAVRSYDNQVVAQEFCMAFRQFSQPIVQRAVGYFYEKRHLKDLIRCASKEKKVLMQVQKCGRIYHELVGWTWWKAFMNKINENRSSGLMGAIRRRTSILQLYPYFNWTETLPVRPPRPLKEVEQMFKDLPLVSIQRKLARERLHTVNVKTMLNERRIKRDFLRAYAAFVQIQISTREVLKLLRKKQHLRLKRKAMDVFKANRNGTEVKTQESDQEKEISANIFAWQRHFFRARQNQTRVIATIAPG